VVSSVKVPIGGRPWAIAITDKGTGIIPTTPSRYRRLRRTQP
jgi:hypothetical protein